MPTPKRNPNDATMRNVRAIGKRLKALAERFDKLVLEVKALKALAGQQARER